MVTLLAIPPPASRTWNPPPYSHDFLLTLERLRFLGLDCRSEGFCVTDWTSWSMMSSVASSWAPFPSSLAGITLPRPEARAESEPEPDL